jgi:hypothetical protein
MVLLSGGVLVVGFSVMPRCLRGWAAFADDRCLVASGVLVLLLIVGVSSPFHGTVTITPHAHAGVLTEMREAP